MFVINICAFFHLKVAKHKVGSFFCFLILIFHCRQGNCCKPNRGKKIPGQYQLVKNNLVSIFFHKI